LHNTPGRSYYLLLILTQEEHAISEALCNEQ
jgi:hypothetical protein